MGVKLDWEIEAEQSGVESIGEDLLDKRERHANRRRTVLAILIVALIVLSVVGGVMARLWYVDHEIEQQLRDTVAAEVTALRIGDVAAYLYVQRSESDQWMLGQTDAFWEYQQLKLDHQVELTGQILALTIEETRARVTVEEIVDGLRYEQQWFYWRYQDGWRHVPMDVTFWGGDETYEGRNLTLSYGGLDADLANELRPSLELLWDEGCRWLACTTPLDHLYVEIVPDPVVGVSWSPDVPNTLRIASPKVHRSRAGVNLEFDVARRIGQLLAERLTENANPDLYPVRASDAEYLVGAIQDWLAGRFLGDGAVLGSGFIDSLVQRYGEQAAGYLLNALQADSTIGVLSATFALPLDVLAVDWREYIQWRLALEPFLLSQGAVPNVLALYDDLAQNEARVMTSDPASAGRQAPTVLRVVVGEGSDGGRRAWALVQYEDGSDGVITFRLVDERWLRSVPDPAVENYLQ